ncbi:hypothetical protein ILYODFUR_006677 [Ilyodon furcidens]|uniref:Secreted protein n=1 Tax=Ilyodon furcidens TaxID=33524 RepID=A0ABV0V2Y9_9TELE
MGHFCFVSSFLLHESSVGKKTQWSSTSASSCCWFMSPDMRRFWFWFLTETLRHKQLCCSCASPQNAQVPQFQQGSVWICSTEPQEVLATSRTRHTGKLVQV